jgi:hypothetical protein
MVKPTLAEQQHERAGNFAPAWQMCGHELLFASRVLRDRIATAPQSEFAGMKLGAIELMLRAMAVECLLKAIWVHRGNKLSQGGEYSPIPGTASHDLIQMADAVALRRKARERDLLRRLTHFVAYPARYPIPKLASDLKLTRSPVSAGRSIPTNWSQPDDKLFDELVAHLDHLLV